MRRLEELKARKSELCRELDAVSAEIYELECADCPAKVGSIIRRRGKEYKVTQVVPCYGGWWLRGNPKRKDGSWGKADRALYDNWEVVA